MTEVQLLKRLWFLVLSVVVLTVDVVEPNDCCCMSCDLESFAGLMNVVAQFVC